MTALRLCFPALASFCLLGTGCASFSNPQPDADSARIVFGSCLKQNAPQPVWTAILDAKPDLFLFLGDNIYGDSEDMSVMARKYRALGKEPGYRMLQVTCPILATWDDHDYGVNDGGADYPMKEASKQEFLRFFDVPETDPVYRHPGIYRSAIHSIAGLRVQILLLDTRTFRGPLARVIERQPDRGPYRANLDSSVPLLGEDQWSWLQGELESPADLRILVSSIQVVPEDHGWEKWMNLPHQRNRLFALLRETDAKGVIVISGDRHHGDLSRMDAGLGYPLYELTASGMNRAMRREINEPNRHRVEGPYVWNHFGLIGIDRSGDSSLITLQLRNETGEIVLSHSFPLSDLQ